MIKSKLQALVIGAVLVAFTASAADAQRDIRTERMQFRRGVTSAVVEASITGYEIVDYKIRVCVYMMRAAARRDETAHYRLEVIITGPGKEHA